MYHLLLYRLRADLRCSSAWWYIIKKCLTFNECGHLCCFPFRWEIHFSYITCKSDLAELIGLFSFLLLLLLRRERHIRVITKEECLLLSFLARLAKGPLSRDEAPVVPSVHSLQSSCSVGQILVMQSDHLMALQPNWAQIVCIYLLMMLFVMDCDLYELLSHWCCGPYPLCAFLSDSVTVSDSLAILFVLHTDMHRDERIRLFHCEFKKKKASGWCSYTHS